MPAKNRTNMKPEDRRNQLLNCAQNLFFSKGFESTTISDILAETGISKGGFYHHFASKEELMFGVFDRLTCQIGESIIALVDDTSRSAVDRFQAIYCLQAETYGAMPMESLIYSHTILMLDENAALLTLLNRKIAVVSIPILTRLIEDGQARGEFTVENAHAAAAFITAINNSFDKALLTAIEARGTANAAKAATELKAISKIQYDTINMVLGLPKDTIKHGWPDFVDTLMAHPVTP